MRNWKIGLILMALSLVPGLALAATSVGDSVSIGGTLTTTGATTLNGAVTIGDATGDLITINGQVINLNVSDGSTATTTLTQNSLKIARVLNTYDFGRFYVDSSGNVFASGTLAAIGNTTLGTTSASSTLTSYGNATFTGNIKPQHHGLYDLGSYTQAWKDVYASGTIYTAGLTIDGNTILGDATSDTVTLTGRVASAILPSTNNARDLGAFANAWKDVYVSGTLYAGSLSLLSSERLVVTNVSSTNMTASGYLQADGAVYLGDAVNDDITVTGRLGTLTISNGSTATSSITYNTLTLGKILNTYNSGKFIVSDAGAVSASSSLAVFGSTALNGAVAIGDATGDLITINGQVINLNVSDGSTATSTLALNSLMLGKIISTYDEGKFYVNASGNVSASGTLAVFGAVTLRGHTTFGDATSTDIMYLNSRVASSIIPTANGSIDLGEFGRAYKDAYVSSTLFVGDLSDLLYVDKPNSRIGAVSSSPFAQLGIGNGGAVTSTIAVGKFCMYAGQEDGTNVYVILGKNQPNNQPFATTSVSCF